MMKTYERFKTSGVEWIGDIPEHWEVKKLKYWIVSTLGGGTPSTSNRDYWNGNIPWVSPKDMKTDFITKTEDYITELAVTESATNLISPERVLIVVRSGILKHTLPVAINKVEVSLNQDMKAFEPNSNLLPLFLFWKLKGQSSDILTTCNKIGATVDSIEMEDLFALPFAVPPLPEQIAIANYLDEKTAQLDKLIEGKRRLIALLKEERSAVINKAVTRGINPHAKLKSTGIDWLGEIPTHWGVKKLKYLVSKVGSGITPSGGANVYQQEGIPLLRSQNIYSDRLALDDIAYISEEIDEQMSNSRIQENDILLNITGGSIGRCFYVPKGFGFGNVNQHVCIIRPVQSAIKTKFLHAFLISGYGQNLVDVCQTGANREGLNFQQIKSFDIPVCDVAEQEQIVYFIEAETGKIDATIAKIEKEIVYLREYRTALISEVVTGKIRVA
jgi:type I restriction enzyme, S subunit